jgi:hypothetical protein
MISVEDTEEAQCKRKYVLRSCHLYVAGVPSLAMCGRAIIHL